MLTYTICSVDFIAESTSKGFSLDDGIEIFIVNKDSQIFVYKNRCPHLGIELHWKENEFLDQDNSLIQCSTHGALFLIENGECVSGPCLGKALEAIPYQVIDNNITITL